MRGAVPWGLVTRASSGWRRVFGIAGQRRVDGAVSLGLCRLGGAVTRASSGWRRVFAIAGQGVVWVAPCLWDCWAGRRVDGAVSLG